MLKLKLCSTFCRLMLNENIFSNACRFVEFGGRSLLVLNVSKRRSHKPYVLLLTLLGGQIPLLYNV